MKRTDKLNKQQVLQIPELSQTMNIREIAELYKDTWQAIYYWIKNLRNRGYKIRGLPQGQKSLLSKE